MDKKTESLKLALEALRDYRRSDDDRVSVAMGILQEALAEQTAQQQDPVGYVTDNFSRDDVNDEISVYLPVGTRIYTSPPAQGDKK